jgi:polyisoprenyl-phosphate glycosyltransferase
VPRARVIEVSRSCRRGARSDSDAIASTAGATRMTDRVLIAAAKGYIGTRTVSQLLNTGTNFVDMHDVQEEASPVAKAQLLSVIVPCYDEEDVIAETVRRLQKLRAELADLEVELIFIDDGSRDRTREILRRLVGTHSGIRLIAFARNFGHQIAVTAGIDSANGDAIVIIDADLQDPPEVIHEMIAKWRDGYDVVYGTRTERLGESLFKTLTARAFYRLLNRLSDMPIPLDTGDFRLISRNVADTLRAMPERDRFVRGMVSWVGFRQTALPYRRAKRVAGISKYPLRKMVRFAVDGILSFSTKPLQISVAAGMSCAVFAALGILYALFFRLFTSTWVPGWTALMIALLLIGGIQLISVGILGEYVGRIYSEIKNRPLYVVQEYAGFDGRGPAMSRSPVVNSK